MRQTKSAVTEVDNKKFEIPSFLTLGNHRAAVQLGNNSWQQQGEKLRDWVIESLI